MIPAFVALHHLLLEPSATGLHSHVEDTLYGPLGIEHPIVQGGMQWVRPAEFVAAVSNAGAHPPSPAQHVAHLRRNIGERLPRLMAV